MVGGGFFSEKEGGYEIWLYMQKMANLAVLVFVVFLKLLFPRVGSSPSDAPEGGVKKNLEKEEG